MTERKSIRNFCTKATIVSVKWDALVCTDIRRMSSLRYTYICKTHIWKVGCESKNLNKIAISKCFFFFFFLGYLVIHDKTCQNVSFAKPRRFLILHVDLVWIFFFFFEKRERRVNFCRFVWWSEKWGLCENITTQRICYNWTWPKANS